MGRPRKIVKKSFELPEDVQQRAKDLGITQEQIDSCGTVEKLIEFMDSINLSSNPDTFPPTETKPVAKVDLNKIPRTINLKKEDIRKEEADCRSIWSLFNRKYSTPGVKKITKTVVFDCVTRKVTEAKYDIEL
jgi:hypothetical protein